MPKALELMQAGKTGFNRVYKDKEYSMTPDAFGMVDMGSMQKLKETGKGADYVTYMHNQLVLMIAKGNP